MVDVASFIPLAKKVLVRRLPDPSGLIDTSAHDRSRDSAIMAEAVVLAVGRGCVVEVGQKVLFNAHWNDLCSAELKGTGSDGNGPLERPMAQWQYASGVKDLYLIQEGDIAGILEEVESAAI